MADTARPPSSDPSGSRPPTPAPGPLSRPILAGVVTALVGFTSSFAVVLTGLTAVGASHAQAASGLLALSLTMGVACIVLAWRYRMPITSAWSTPGAALLAASSGAAHSAAGAAHSAAGGAHSASGVAAHSTAGGAAQSTVGAAARAASGATARAASGAIEGGWSAAVGAFLIVAALILLTALVPRIGSLIAAIPPSIAQAMLAGVLLPLCLAPVAGLATNPWGVLPVVLTWLLFARLVPRWAVPLAFVAATIVIVAGLVASGAPVAASALIPHIELTMPTFTVGALVGIALPLFIVTMASQNVPGVAVMRSFGYEVPWRPAMLVTGLGTALGATAGGHAINLAAISAALAASPDAEPDPKRRWIAGVSTGVSYIELGGCSAAFAALVVLAPAAVIPAVAGVALLSAFGSAVQQAIDDPGERIPAVVTFLVAASGVAFWGVSAAFWALLAGLLVRSVLHLGRR